MTAHAENITERPRSSEKKSVFSNLKSQPADALLELIALCREDNRENKIDVGVGVFCDDQGHTPVMRAVKAAEIQLIHEQNTKSYLGSAGDIEFFRRLIPVVFGNDFSDHQRLSGLQTPGGTGALRLAFDLIYAAHPEAAVHYGNPTWVNHLQIIANTGLNSIAHPFYNKHKRQIDFDAVLDDLKHIKTGDVVLLHGCCHNPTGCDFTFDQWKAMSKIISERGLLPVIDLAYQGLGDGLEEDVAGLRWLSQQVDEMIVTYSCDKNFGLYRERTGAIFVLSQNAESRKIVQSNLIASTRTHWSMPPDHGAAAVRIILDNEALRVSWQTELRAMQQRIIHNRQSLAKADSYFTPLLQQKGMFSILPLLPEQIEQLRIEDAIYMAPSGRINVAGLTPTTIDPFVKAIQTVI